MRITAPTDEPVDLTAVDLFDPGLYADGDPHPIWAAMRASKELHRQVLPDGRAFWSVTRHADACRVLGDHTAFTAERGSLLGQLGRGDVAAGRMLVSTDPPRHDALRRPLHAMFTVKALAGWRDQVQAAARRVLEQAADGDLATAALAFPMVFTGALMGVPEKHWDELVEWTAMAAAPEDPGLRIGSPGATLAIAHHGLFEFFRAQLRERRDRPDLIGLLATMRSDGEPLADDEVVYNCYSVLLGANATTPHTVTGTVLALIEHPDQYDRVAADPSLVDSLVEEGLRWTSPASSFLRHATVDVELGGSTVRAGDAVAVWIGAANRDEAVFDDPYRFDVGRTGNRHIAFGFGPHYCLGAALARMALRALFTEIVTRGVRFELTGPVRHLRSNFVAGISQMPVRLT
jgi:cytochrome P450